MGKITATELRGILASHALWLVGDKDGVRADLQGADVMDEFRNRKPIDNERGEK